MKLLKSSKERTLKARREEQQRQGGGMITTAMIESARQSTPRSPLSPPPLSSAVSDKKLIQKLREEYEAKLEEKNNEANLLKRTLVKKVRISSLFLLSSLSSPLSSPLFSSLLSLPFSLLSLPFSRIFYLYSLYSLFYLFFISSLSSLSSLFSLPPPTPLPIGLHLFFYICGWVVTNCVYYGIRRRLFRRLCCRQNRWREEMRVSLR